MEPNLEEVHPPSFPSRMFAVGDEPIGIRVTPYHKPLSIKKILNALDINEVEVIRNSQFGKLVDIAELPSFSGRFGRFLLSRQLKVSKKHEAWFLFAGNPVRFSLREFAAVTGLKCDNFPRSPKKKSTKTISGKPYWVDLFGTMKEDLVSYVVTMLKKKTVVDPDVRIKYALLALLSAVILPTSHYPRISEQHAEKIKDLDKFLAYPWGRVSFGMLMSSIKERDEVSLSQKTIALKGFVLSIQLVMIEVVPSLTGVVQDGGSSGSESDHIEDDDTGDDDSKGKKTINPAYVREIDNAAKATVISIIPYGAVQIQAESDLGWADEVEDALVDNLVRCTEEGFRFSNSHFTGGATVADVALMQEEAKNQIKSRKSSKHNIRQTCDEPFDVDYVASIVKSSVSTELRMMGEEIKNLGMLLTNSQSLMRNNVKDLLKQFHSDILKLLSQSTSRPSTSCPHNSSVHANQPGTLDEPTNIIIDAIRFANEGSAPTVTPPAFTDNIQNSSVNVEDIISGKTMAPASRMAASTSHTNLFSVNAAHTISSSVDASLPSTLLDTDDNPRMDNAGSGSASPRPSFSLGLTQEELQRTRAGVCVDDNGDEITDKVADQDAPAAKTNENAPAPSTDNDDVVPLNRRSKRQKAVPRQLVGDYQCDRRTLTRAWEAHANAMRTPQNTDFSDKFGVLSDKLSYDFVLKVGSLSVGSNDIAAIVHRSTHLPVKVVDVLIHHSRLLFRSCSDHSQPKSSVFLDTKFVALLAKTFAKFSETTKKETFRFPQALSDYRGGDFSFAEAARIYLPFNFDKKHWVGVCVDCSLSQVIVLDCNTTLRTDAMIAKDMQPISQMLPYLLRQAGNQLIANEPKAFTIDRPRSIPQNQSLLDSGMTVVLLIQAHAVAGVEVCKLLTPEVVDVEAQKTAVMIYEENVGPL